MVINMPMVKLPRALKLAELADYAQYHFSTEEAVWMESLGEDPHLQSHQHSHRQFFEHIAGLQAGHRPFQAVLDDLPDLSGYQVYACGAPIVVDSARAEYTAQAGLPEDEFFADSFTSAADKATA